jgi:hypothetical protein
MHTGHDRATNAHESAHLLHAALRNARAAPGAPRVNCFYMMGGRACAVPEPPIALDRVPGFVPARLRGYRFRLYLERQVRAWNDRSLYVFDEGAAYLIDALVSLDDAARGVRGVSGPAPFLPTAVASRDPGPSGSRSYPAPSRLSRYAAASAPGEPMRAVERDGVSGCLEFAIYGLAHALAVREHAPAYWRGCGQYRAWLGWFLGRCEAAWREGAGLPGFAALSQRGLLEALRADPSAAPHRDLLSAEFGGAWLSRPGPGA